MTVCYSWRIKHSTPPAGTPSHVLALPQFRALWLAVVAANFGDWLRFTAIGWYTLELGGGAAAVSIVTAMGILPQLLLTLAGGVLADRLRKRRLLQVLATLQMLGVLGFFFAVHAGIMTIWGLAIAGFVIGSFTALWQPVYLSFIPDLVPESLIDRAMGISLSSAYAARALGPLVAGVLYASLGVSGLLLINAFTFAVPVAVLFFVRPLRDERPSRKASPLGALREGAAQVRADQPLASLWAATAAVSFLALPVLALIPVFVKQIFAGDAVLLGVFTSISGVGQLIGALLVSFGVLARFEQSLVFQFTGYVAMAVCLIFFGASWSVATSLAALLLFNVWHGVLSPRVNAIVQQRSQAERRGTVQAIFLVVFGLVPLGQITVGWFAEYFGLIGSTVAIGFTFLIVSGALLAVQRNHW